MHPFIKITLQITWGLLLLYWMIGAFTAKKVAQHESLFKRFFFYWLPLLAAVLLLGPGDWYGHTLLREQFIAHSNLVGITALCLCVPGAALACWSRYILGKNWSISVELKQGHELIMTGPYKYVRNPIYTGLLLLFTGNALIVGDWRGIFAIIIVFVSFWRKLKLEEQWLNKHFGEVYTNYKKQTKALFPFLL